jgi:hypothetical protein
LGSENGVQLALPNPPSAYDRALGLCPDDPARARLSRLGAELGLGAHSSEWVVVTLFAETRKLFGGEATEPERAALFAQLDRIESRVDDLDARVFKATSPLAGNARPLEAHVRHPQLDTIQGRIDGVDSRLRALDTHIRAGSTPGIQPIAVHLIAIAVLLATLAIGYFASRLTMPGSILLLGACTALAYLYVAPLIAPSLSSALRKLIR